MAEQTFFDVAKRSYADVAREPGVDTTQFLEATETVVSMFGRSRARTSGRAAPLTPRSLWVHGLLRRAERHEREHQGG